MMGFSDSPGRERARGCPRFGFSLVEVVVALLVLEVGLLASAGMILSAQRTLARARLLQHAVMEASRTADSLTAAGWTTRGFRSFAGGRVEWIPEDDEEDGVRIFAVGVQSGDTLIRMRTWSLANGSTLTSGQPPLSAPSGSGGSAQ